ncbi:hypothetical protein BN12_790032 [Nostocoides japonicum T1-X7]|uniref:Major facilitator superfamily (MFS) profile domain-containing protein n=1 Tax=Nostocoides japonicum T1-X7 TaxID=1194083 RepID=A0A077M1M6_9MICO|nr:hypothetical protein [Tetrasphaera japonica]CCH80203.1 hypothetical protein BN12_790032 [Tetrasphaera japonica T1-X7]
MSARAGAVGTAVSERFQRRFTIRLVIVLVGGMFLNGDILGLVGPVISSSMKTDLGVNSLWEGPLAAALLIGIFFRSPIGGWAGDEFGRKPRVSVTDNWKGHS